MNALINLFSARTKGSFSFLNQKGNPYKSGVFYRLRKNPLSALNGLYNKSICVDEFVKSMDLSGRVSRTKFVLISFGSSVLHGYFLFLHM